MTATVPSLLQPMKDRLTAATPGPWVEYHENGTEGVREAFNCPPATGALLIDYTSHDQRQRDANFIAHARTDMPKLLDAIAAVQALADSWTRRGESDMAYSKTVHDDEVALAVLADGVDLIEKAGHIRNALTQALGGDTA